MAGPRLSIIPSDAVTDIRLEGRDLQVLALLGRHTNNGGWCSRSQVKMAQEIRCGRSTLQRSLVRLIEAGYVQQQPLLRKDGGDRAHEYRVLLDDVRPAEFINEIDGSSDDAEAPGERSEGPDVTDETLPTHGQGVPTGGQGVPTQSGQGVPTHGWAPIRTTLLKRKREREAHADAGREEIDPHADDAFMAFMAIWPTAAADNLARSYRAWLGLCAAERSEAVASIPAYLVFVRSVKRTAVCAAFSYLSERRWKLVPLAAGKPGAETGSLELKNFGIAFWASMHLRIRRGERVGFTMKAAVEGKRWPTPLRDIADPEAELALVRMDTKSAETAAWLDYFRRLQIFSLRPEEIVAPFVWMPARWPPGHASEVTVMDDDDVML